MRVRAETRDTEKLHKVINRVVIIFAVYLAVLIAVFACAGIIGGTVFVVLALLVTAAGAPLIIIEASRAAKLYNDTWMTGEFDLCAKDGSLYLDGTKLQVNLNRKSDVLYAHDLGAGGNPSKAGIYLTVEGDDKAALLDYMDECGVEVNPEPVIKGRGKYAAVTAAANGLSRYRRK